jgi:riboflavin kinase/FMN adenylyltransferase
MSGIVTDGDNLGRLIGYPTANISFDNYIIPKYGVYITKTVVGEKKYPSLTNVGIRPTIKDSNELRIETYILDFDSDIYGKKIDICFLKYLREEMKFETFDELKKKIDEDVRKAKDFFKIP